MIRRPPRSPLFPYPTLSRSLPAAMHNDRIDPDRFEEDDFARDPMAFRGIRGIHEAAAVLHDEDLAAKPLNIRQRLDRKSTRLNSSHLVISYAVFCLKKKKTK